MAKNEEKADIASKIKEAVSELNELIREAKKGGLSVVLKTNESVMAESTPPLRVTIFETKEY